MDFTIQVVDNPNQAPRYDKATYSLVAITKCIVVGNGTIEGSPSVDIQLEDANGIKYVAMTTGRLLETLGAVITGKRERDEAERKN